MYFTNYWGNKEKLDGYETFRFQLDDSFGEVKSDHVSRSLKSETYAVKPRRSCVVLSDNENNKKT